MSELDIEGTWGRIGSYSGWRRRVARVNFAKIARKYYRDAPRRSVYQFGVFSGGSICELHRLLGEAGVSPSVMYGFDSFEGLPPITDEEAKASVEQFGTYQWKSGDFHAGTFHEATDPKALLDAVFTHYLDCPVHLIPGWFEHSLTPENAVSFGMDPALYIDLDADIYSSTVEALEFVIQQGIARPGTVVGYDDWGGSAGWKRCGDGVSKAHEDISAKYGLRWKLLQQVGRAYPHVGRMYLLKAVKGLTV